MIPVLSRVRMHKLLLAGGMNSRSPASFLNKMLQLRDKSRTSGIASTLLIYPSLTLFPSLYSVPAIAKDPPERRSRREQVRRISRTEM